ncbi:MAG: hypothetical protein ACYC26_04855 [Phycisphaerales bacterium]
MKPILAGMFGALCLTLTMALNAAETKIDAKQKVAEAYFAALATGDVAKVDEVTDVPFSFDRKEVLRTREQVHDAHAKLANEKAKREMPQYTIVVTDRAPKLDPAVFAKHVVYHIVARWGERSDEVDIYVTDSPSPKVIGLSG